MDNTNPSIALQAQVGQVNPLQAYMQGIQIRNALIEQQMQRQRANALASYAQAMQGATSPSGDYNGQSALAAYAKGGSAMPDVTNALLAGTGQNTANQQSMLGLMGNVSANQALESAGGDPMAAMDAAAGSGYGANAAPLLAAAQGAQGGALTLAGTQAANAAAQQTQNPQAIQALVSAQGLGASGAPAVGAVTQTEQQGQNLAQDRAAQLRNLAGGLALNPHPDPQSVDSFIDMAATHGLIAPDDAEMYKQEVAQIGPDKNELHSWLTQVFASGGPANLGQVMPHAGVVNTGLTYQNVVTNPLTGQVEQVSAVAPNQALTPVMGANGTQVLMPTNQAAGATASNPLATTAASGVGNIAANIVSAANTGVNNAPQQLTALNNAYKAVAALPSTGVIGHVAPWIENSLASIPGLANVLQVKPGAAINYDEAAKFLADYANKTAQTAGAGTDYTNIQQRTALPNLANTQQALLQMIRYQMALTQYNASKSQYIMNNAKTNAAAAPQANLDYSTNVGLTPFMYRYMTPAERQQYTTGMTQQQIDQLSNQVKSLNTYGSAQ